MFKKRDPIGIVIVSVLTVSLYWFYWVASTQNAMKSHFGMKFSGVATVFFIIMTFGLYGLYWVWSLGKVVKELSGKDYSFIFLLLQMTGFYCIAAGMAQNEINKHIKRFEEDTQDLLL